MAIFHIEVGGVDNIGVDFGVPGNAFQTISDRAHVLQCLEILGAYLKVVNALHGPQPLPVELMLFVCEFHCCFNDSLESLGFSLKSFLYCWIDA